MESEVIEVKESPPAPATPTNGNGNDVGNRIRAARGKRRLSQADLARAIGVSREAVSQWEAGRVAQISAKHAAALAQALEVDVGWLQTGIGSGPSAGIPVSLVLTSAATSEAQQGMYRVGLVVPTDHHAYAVLLLTSDFEPRCYHGEAIVASPSTKVLAGDDVIVWVEGGGVCFRTLLASRPHVIQLQDPVNHEITSMAPASIKQMHVVIAIARPNAIVAVVAATH